MTTQRASGVVVCISLEPWDSTWRQSCATKRSAQPCQPKAAIQWHRCWPTPCKLKARAHDCGWCSASNHRHTVCDCESEKQRLQ